MSREQGGLEPVGIPYPLPLFIPLSISFLFSFIGHIFAPIPHQAKIGA